jgi:hypothetical protein
VAQDHDVSLWVLPAHELGSLQPEHLDSANDDSVVQPRAYKLNLINQSIPGDATIRRKWLVVTGVCVTNWPQYSAKSRRLLFLLDATLGYRCHPRLFHLRCHSRLLSSIPLQTLLFGATLGSSLFSATSGSSIFDANPKVHSSSMPTRFAGEPSHFY